MSVSFNLINEVEVVLSMYGLRHHICYDSKLLPRYTIHYYYLQMTTK